MPFDRDTNDDPAEGRTSSFTVLAGSRIFGTVKGSSSSLIEVGLPMFYSVLTSGESLSNSD